MAIDTKNFESAQARLLARRTELQQGGIVSDGIWRGRTSRSAPIPAIARFSSRTTSRWRQSATRRRKRLGKSRALSSGLPAACTVLARSAANLSRQPGSPPFPRQ
jgi:hypothetical protein